MIELVTVDARSTIALLGAIEALYPAMRIIQVFLDNARYHHARAVQDWLARPGRRIRLHFVPVPASEPDRAALGTDAQERQPQPMPCH